MKQYTFKSKSFEIIYNQPEKHVYKEVLMTEDNYGKVAKYMEVDGKDEHYDRVDEVSYYLGDRKRIGITIVMVFIPEYKKLYDSERKNFLLIHKEELLNGFEIIRTSETVFREVKIEAISEYFYYLIEIFTNNFSLEEIYGFLGEINLNLGENLPNALIDRIRDVLFDDNAKKVPLDEKNWAEKILKLLGIKGYEELVIVIREWGVYKIDIPRIYNFYSDIPIEIWELYINRIDLYYSLTKKVNDSEFTCFKTLDEIRVELLKAIETHSKNYLGNFEIEEIMEEKYSSPRKNFVWALEHLFKELKLTESVGTLRRKRKLVEYLVKLFSEKIDCANPKFQSMNYQYSEDFKNQIEDGKFISDKDSERVEGYLIRETEKAALIKLPNHSEAMWIPKSQIRNEFSSGSKDIQSFYLSKWIIDKKGISPQI